MSKPFNEAEHVATLHKIAMERSLTDAQITDLLILGLHAEEARVKQYALWHIAKILNLTHFLSDVEDHGKLL